ncbi:DDE_Tnp_IS1595 domain-containing protein [Trichonephila clavata]|uniref:DDE_Tnp_IS1595 domain-containing protein n=1 Tax=Trichonephila clavata TaxID=2740835 RepID=A0A8X6KR71_TRICU|nr:DDE_Tnp_IS1595 domain-containing protein [Trichonephila clavata]
MESGLLKDELNCAKCREPCSLIKRKKSSNGSIWRCKKCRGEKSLRIGSWFSCSKLNLQEIILLTWHLISGTKTCDIERDLGFSSATSADWRQFVHEQVLDHVELTSSKIGGVGKVVEVDESKFAFGKKHHQGSPKILPGKTRFFDTRGFLGNLDVNPVFKTRSLAWFGASIYLRQIGWAVPKYFHMK